MKISKPLRIILQLGALAAIFIAVFSYLHNNEFGVVAYALVAIILLALSRRDTGK
jgi:hypothetical protein